MNLDTLGRCERKKGNKEIGETIFALLPQIF